MYSGDRVAVCNPPAGSADTKPLAWHHNGVRNARAMRSWVKDNLERPTQTHTERLFGELSQLSNLGGYSPRYRNVNERRCQTSIDLRNGDTQEQNLELGDFVTRVLEGRGPVIAAERDTKADCAKSFNLLYWLIEKLLQRSVDP